MAIDPALLAQLRRARLAKEDDQRGLCGWIAPGQMQPTCPGELARVELEWLNGSSLGPAARRLRTLPGWTYNREHQVWQPTRSAAARYRWWQRQPGKMPRTKHRGEWHTFATDDASGTTFHVHDQPRERLKSAVLPAVFLCPRCGHGSVLAAYALYLMPDDDPHWMEYQQRVWEELEAERAAERDTPP